MAAGSDRWTPQLRLRHLQAVVLRNVALPAGFSWDTRLSYAIHLQEAGHGPTLAYSSDKLQLQPDMYWSAIEYDHSNVPHDTVHGPLTAHITISFYTYSSSSRAAASSQQQQQQQQQGRAVSMLASGQLSTASGPSLSGEGNAKCSSPASQAPVSASATPPALEDGADGQASSSGTPHGNSNCVPEAGGSLPAATGGGAGAAVQQGAAAGTAQPLLQCRLKVLEGGWVQLQLHVQLAPAGRPPMPPAQCGEQGIQQQAGADCATDRSKLDTQQEEMGVRDVPSSNAKELCGERDSSSCGGHSPPAGPHVCSTPMALENDKDSTAAAAAAAVAAHTTAPQGLCKVLIKRVVLKTQALVPVSPYELKVPSESTNQVVVALRGRLYTLQQPSAAEQAAAAMPVPDPPTQQSAATGEGSASHSRSRSSSSSSIEGEWAEVEDKETLSRQDSGLRRQQQVFRWMASNTNSALDTLEAQGSVALEEEAEALLAGSGGATTPEGAAAPRPLGILGLFGQVLGFQRAAASQADSQDTQAAAGEGAARVGPVRVYHPQEFVAQLQRLVALHQQLHTLQARRGQLHQQLADLLEQQQRRHQQQLQLANAKRAAGQQLQAEAAASRALQQQQQASTRRQQMLEVACTALAAAVGEVKGGQTRLRQAEAVLAGPEGLGRWRELHQQLVMRRCHLVSRLAVAYQLGPTTRSVLSGPPLAEKLDAGWWATGPTLTTMNSNGSNSSGAAGASNSNSGSQHQLQQHNHHQQKAARLLIASLELSPAVAKRGLEGSMGWDGSHHDEEQRVAAALGYVAHMVHLLSAYLDVPLRFPLLPRSSRSQVVDPAPLQQQPTPAAGRGRRARELHHPADEALGSTAAQQSPAAVTPLTLPLHYEAGDRTRFAYAIFLLNKDVEQLLAAHGLPSHGPNQLLANLYQLVLVARSALPLSEQQPLLSPGPSGAQQEWPVADAGSGSGSGSSGVAGARGQEPGPLGHGASHLSAPQPQQQPAGAAVAAAAAAAEPGPAVWDWYDLLPLPPVDPG